MWIEYLDDYSVPTRARLECKKKEEKHWFRKPTYEDIYYLHVEKRNSETLNWEYYSRRNITNEKFFIMDGDDFYYGFIEDIIINYDDEDYKSWLRTISNEDTHYNYIKEKKQKELKKRLQERVDITE